MESLQIYTNNSDYISDENSDSDDSGVFNLLNEKNETNKPNEPNETNKPNKQITWIRIMRRRLNDNSVKQIYKNNENLINN